MWQQLVGILIALNGLTTIEAAQPRYDLHIYKFTCTNDSAHIVRLTCDYTKLARNLFIFNGDFMLDQDFGPQAEGHLIIQITPTESGKTLTFLDGKMGICEGLTNIGHNPILKNLMAEARKSTNLPYFCPIKKDFLYRANNYTVTNAIIPPIALYANFTATLKIYEDKKLFGSGQVQGAIIPRSK